MPDLERLWRRDDVGVREKALWRLMFETAAWASEALSINVEDLELGLDQVAAAVGGMGGAPPDGRLRAVGRAAALAAGDQAEAAVGQGENACVS